MAQRPSRSSTIHPELVGTRVFATTMVRGTKRGALRMRLAGFSSVGTVINVGSSGRLTRSTFELVSYRGRLAQSGGKTAANDTPNGLVSSTRETSARQARSYDGIAMPRKSTVAVGPVGFKRKNTGTTNVANSSGAAGIRTSNVRLNPSCSSSGES